MSSPSLRVDHQQSAEVHLGLAAKVLLPSTSTASMKHMPTYNVDSAFKMYWPVCDAMTQPVATT